MDLKDSVKSLEISELNTLTKILKSNLENNNIKYTFLEVSNIDERVNKKREGVQFKLKGSFNGSISLKLKNESINLNIIKKEFKLLADRYISNTYQVKYSEEEHELVGISQYIIDIQKFISTVSSTNKSILIEGDHGCEHLTLAASIHCNSLQGNNDLYNLNCKKLNVLKNPLNYLEKLKNIKRGSIFISNIDNLDQSLQFKLLDIISSLSDSVRILASSEQNLKSEVNSGRFNRKLYFFVSDVMFYLPRLKERKEDIPYILEEIIKRYAKNKKISNECVQLIKKYDWPKNHTELKSTILKLINLSKNNTISVSDIERYTPHLLLSKRNLIAHKRLIKELVKKDLSSLKNFHPSLQKALAFISENYDQNISLDILSHHSHISPSHLSYLFRSNFGISFKVIISSIRVEIIKTYFQLYPQKSITESALNIGFGDLSHFEKTFKKHTGMTPKNFKLNLKNKI